MIHFVLTLGPAGSCGTMGPALAEALRDTTGIGGAVIEADSPSGAWSMRAVAARDAVLDPRWYADGEGLVVCNGTVTGDPRAVSPAGILRRFRQGGQGSAVGPLTGTYNLVCCAPEHGLTLSGDFVGLYPLYYGYDAGRVVISNRASTVAAVSGATGWNRQALGWVLGAGHLCGEDMAVAGVRALRAGQVGRVGWGRSFLSEGTPPDVLMPPPGTGVGRPDLSPAEWDAVTQDLVRQVEGVAALRTPMYLQLSGGKDSRLLLSLLVAAGCTDVESYTSGPPDGAEVRCASEVAAVAGIAHVQGMPRAARIDVRRRHVGGERYAGDLAPIWRQVAVGQGRFDGSVSNSDGSDIPPGAASLLLKGLGGEVFRYKSRPGPLVRLGLLLPPRPGSSLDLAAITACMVDQLDPLGLVSVAEQRRQAEWLEGWVRRSADSVRPDLLPDLFYIEQRLGRIHGPVIQELPLRVVANPLVSPVAASLYAELSLHVRSTDRLHFEVMRRAAPELLSVPFVDQVWRPEIQARNDVELPSGPYGRGSSTPPASPSRFRRQHRLPLGDSGPVRRARRVKLEAGDRVRARARTDWLAGSRWSPGVTEPHNPTWDLVERAPEAVTALFRQAADAGLAEICKVDRLCDLTRRPGRFLKSEEHQITNAIGIALLLLGRAERPVETQLCDR